MNWKALVLSIGATAMVAGSADAITITNEDDVEHTLEVIVGEGIIVSETHQLEAGGTLADFCNTGCTIKLKNGAEQKFDGEESVTIKGGEFILVN